MPAYNKRFGAMAGVTSNDVTCEHEGVVLLMTFSVPRHRAKPPPRCTQGIQKQHSSQRVKRLANSSIQPHRRANVHKSLFETLSCYVIPYVLQYYVVMYSRNKIKRTPAHIQWFIIVFGKRRPKCYTPHNEYSPLSVAHIRLIIKRNRRRRKAAPLR